MMAAQISTTEEPRTWAPAATSEILYHQTVDMEWIKNGNGFLMYS